MTEKAYRRLPQCVEDAAGTKLVPMDVACRRKSKKYGLPNAEARLAMAAAVFDVLTVTNPENTKFAVPYPSQERFVSTIEILSRDSGSDDDAEDVGSDAYISSEISSAHDDSEDMEAQIINGIEAGESDRDNSFEYEAE
ncbi:unnamed protein product [Phytophthora fragariaefolia]|uniref:Unnamed protein product n=1 Tax=Phytophthora fragariaefolia TaxID=1490495 RepID=A0A9W6XNY0_9STRA|nr:unnamed protein product [Phytophthora fragariaefolia]